MEKDKEENRVLIIVVPIYKTELSAFEKISFVQLRCVMHNYSICVVHPYSIREKVDDMLKIMKCINVYSVSFDDQYFESKETYSSLCMSRDFYARFAKYEYMLIYQLDAFIFSDRVKEFIDIGCDYIGAPLINSVWKEYHVGNGGFSLRKIERFLEITKKKDEILRNNPRKDRFIRAEDDFYSYCGVVSDINFISASIKEALRFSLQDDSYLGISNINDNGLPMGIHHFPDYNYHFWYPYIKAFGYDLPEVSDVDYKNTLPNDHEIHKREDFLNLVNSLNCVEKYNLRKNLRIEKDRKYCLWGAGEWGYFVLRLLSLLGVCVECVFEKNPEQYYIYAASCENTEIDNIKEKIGLEKAILQICVRNCDQDISNYLIKEGFKPDLDFIRFSDFKQNLDETMQRMNLERIF